MSVIKDVLKNVDQTEDVSAEVKDTLHLLYDLSKEKAENFENKIDANLRTAGTPENRTVAVSSTLASHQEIRVITKKTANEDITDKVKTALKDIFKGKKKIVDGLAGLISTSLKVVLGEGEGTEQEEHAYYIATEGLAIVRLDLMYWCRDITAKSITAYAEKNFVCVAVKSSVNVSKLSLNTFLSVYNDLLSKCNIDETQINKEIQNAKEIYEQLRENNQTEAVTLPFPVENCGVIESVKNKVTGIWPA